MKKLTRLLIMTWAVIAAMTACQSEDVTNAANEEVAVSIGVQAEDAVQSRTEDGETTTTVQDFDDYKLRFILEVWTQGDNPECYTRVIAEADDKHEATFELTLLAGRTFDFLLWADYVHKEDLKTDMHYCTTNGLMTVSKMNYTSAVDEINKPELAETRDAFFAHKAITVTTSFNENITLYRALAQLNIYTSDYTKVSTNFQPTYTSITMPSAPAGFNVLTGEPYGSQTDPTVKVAVSPVTVDGTTYYKMFTGYYFTSPSGKNVYDFDANFCRTVEKEENVVTTYKMTSIPMQQNYRTNIYGALLTNTGKLTVKIDAEFNKPDIDVTVPKDNIPQEDGLYYSLDGGKWTEWTGETAFTKDNASIAVASVGTETLTSDHLQAIRDKDFEVVDLSNAEYTTTEFPNTFGIKKYDDSNDSKLRKISLPSNITNLAAYALGKCSKLSDVVLPDGLTSISTGAFLECTSLTKVALPANVKTIGYIAFRNCTSLENINLENVTTYATNTDDANSQQAFSGCTNLNIEVTFPAGTTIIPYGIFARCSKISKVTLPAGLETIDQYAFQECSSLKQITIPSTVKNIAYSAFRGSGLSSIDLPTGLETIGGYAFYECKDLTSAPIPNTVTSIGICAFRYAGLTGKVIIPGSAKIAGTVVFADNLSLTEATIETGYTDLVLPLGFLYGCRNLKKVTFPSNTKELKNRTLWGCSNLAEIYCYAKEAPKIMFEEFGAINSHGSNEYTGINVPKENRKLYVPKGSKDSYTKEKQTYTNDKGEEVEEDNYWKTILIGKLGYEILEIEEESSTSPDTEEGE